MKTFWGAVALVAAAAVSLTPPPATGAPSPEAINKAVDKAKEYLRQKRSGTHWDHQSMSEAHSVGLTALCAIALLEAGVPRNDPMITSAANYVRSSIPLLNKPRAPATYNVALAILFLDRMYGDQEADSIIRRLTIRLAAAQNQDWGAWTYECPELRKEEAQWLKFLEDNEHKPLPEDAPKKLGQSGSTNVDNSNTQFALLGLWIGRRHKVPVNYPLFLAERRFRKTQTSNGWTYGAESGVNNSVTPSMTAAGLLALALGFGASNESGVTIVRSGGKAGETSGVGAGAAAGAREPKEFDTLDSDAQVVRAKEYIVSTLRTATPQSVEHFHYFLWSLERVCVLFGWEKDINGFDWYNWGADWLVRTQEADGSWGNDFHTGSVPNTAFCILFLKKADLIPDAKRALKSTVVRADNINKKKPTTTASRANDAKKVAEEKANDAQAAAEEKANQEKEEANRKMAEARKVADLVVNGAGLRQEKALAQLRDTPGKEYTIAMVEAIKKIGGGGLQTLVRDALADRLKRQTPNSIINYLRGEEKELQVAAAWAAAIKDPPIKEAIPDIIPLLGDPDEQISTKAYEALKILSVGEDFGKSADKWKEWWEKVSKSKATK